MEPEHPESADESGNRLQRRTGHSQDVVSDEVGHPALKANLHFLEGVGARRHTLCEMNILPTAKHSRLGL